MEAQLKEAARFLAEYSVLLFGSGATCVRMDKNVRRIAASLGMNVEYSILPRHIHITVEKGDHHYTNVVAIRDMPPSFAIISNLSKLSWQMADRRMSLHCAQGTLDRIALTGRVYPWLLPVLVSLANACFCGLFAGDWMAMALVFIATYVGFRVKTLLGQRHWDFRLVIIASAFISTLITSSGVRLIHSGTPEIAVSTCILYLVPGIPFINSFCDLIDRHYLCAFGRFMNALVMTACLSMGLIAGMMLMKMPMF